MYNGRFTHHWTWNTARSDWSQHWTYFCAGQGDVETVTLLLEQGADVHATNSRGATFLIAAAYRNHLEVAEILIDAGADVNVQDNTQQSAYLITTSDGYLELWPAKKY